jgi:Domain of unknown function (DUF4781)
VRSQQGVVVRPSFSTAGWSGAARGYGRFAVLPGAGCVVFDWLRVRLTGVLGMRSPVRVRWGYVALRWAVLLLALVTGVSGLGSPAGAVPATRPVSISMSVSVAVHTVAEVSVLPGVAQPVGPSWLRAGPAPVPPGGNSGGDGSPAPHHDSSGSSSSGSDNAPPVAHAPATSSSSGNSGGSAEHPTVAPAPRNVPPSPPSGDGAPPSSASVPHSGPPSSDNARPTLAPVPGTVAPPESPGAQALPSSVPGSRPVSGAVTPAGVQPTAVPVAPALPAGVPPTVGLTPRLVQAPVPGQIALPSGQGAADWNRLLPGLAKALRPTQLGQTSGPVVDPPGVNPPKPVTAMSGSTPISTDPGTAGLLRDYVNGPDAGSGQLDFGSTPVDAAHRTSLVDTEGGDAGKVDTTIHDLGSANPNVTQTPILLRNDKGQFGTATLFQVKGADGQTHLVDAQGAKYTDFNNYLKNNELDDNWTIIHPAHLDTPAGSPQQLVSGPAHVTTFWGHVGKIGDKIAGPAMIVGGTVGVVGSATLGALGAVPSAGADLVPAIEGVIASAALVSDGAALYSAGRSAADLFNRYQHGRNINPTDPQAFNDYLNTLAAGAGAIRATRGLTQGGLRRDPAPIHNGVGSDDDLPRIMSTLRESSQGKGNFGVGSGTGAQADEAGRAWVGDNFKIASDGKTMISSDGLRQYRPPSTKPRLGKAQANFERRFTPGGQWQSNGHFDVVEN